MRTKRTDLPPTHQKALNVLDRDGSVTEQEMIVRLRPAYPEAVRSVIRQLTEDGWVVTDAEGYISRYYPTVGEADRERALEVLCDPSVIVPQDQGVWELLASWRNAPSDT